MYLPTEPNTVLSARATAAPSSGVGPPSIPDAGTGGAVGQPFGEVQLAATPPTSIDRDRFAARVVLPSDPLLCWGWTGGHDRYGYTRFKLRGATVPISGHQFAYTAFVGPIPADRPHIDHTCHSRDSACAGGLSCPHRGCVNPAHLEAVTPRENALRSAPAHRVVCLRGHEYTEANTYRTPRGTRRCRMCRAEDRRRRTLAARSIAL